MRTLLALVSVSLTLTGCVSMDAAECRAANWQELGYRDGIYGLQRMDIAYDEQCGKHGAKPDAAAYATGWQDGHWEYENRAIRDSTD
jgi:hypothetical protein